jgi:BolA protein
VALEVIHASWQHGPGMLAPTTSGVGTHFRVRISSAQFRASRPWRGTGLCMMHWQDFLDQGLHALAIEASLPPA